MTAQFVEEPGVASNWGIFGDDDELGTLNLLDSDAVLRGVGAVTTGERFTLNLPLHVPDHKGSGPRYERVSLRSNDQVGSLVVNDDAITFATQGSSQWDALAHCGLRESRGIFYNGVGLDNVDESGRARRLGIERMAEVGIVGRGVLLDVARLMADGAAEPLADDHVITTDETLECARRQGVELLPGDIVVYRTGWLGAKLRSGGLEEAIRGPQPGIVPAHAELAHRQGWAAVAADNLGVEAFPPSDPAASAHVTMLRNLGMPFGELLVVDDLAASCAVDGRWVFLFVAVPLRAVGSFGSPANAVAIR